MPDAATVLLQEREAAGMSRQELSYAAKVPLTTIHRIEAGDISPTVRMWERLTVALPTLRLALAVSDHRIRAVVSALERHHGTDAAAAIYHLVRQLQSPPLGGDSKATRQGVQEGHAPRRRPQKAARRNRADERRAAT